MRIVRYYPRALTGDGGMTHAVRNWAGAMARAGAQVTVAYDEEGPLPVVEGVRWSPVRHVGTSPIRVPVNLHRAIRGADLLVLHSGWTLYNIRAAAVARRLRIPYVLEPRGAYDPHIVHRKALLKRAWWWSLEKRLVANARGIHVFFEQERPHLEALGYGGRLIVASNGVNPPPDASWDGGSGRYVLWLGRFDLEHKGLDLLLESIRLLPTVGRPLLRIQGPDWRGRKERVRRLISAMGLEPWAKLGEPLYGDAKRHVLRAARGFVYPSRWDACPNSVLEAVSLGIPTLATSYPLGCLLADRGAAIVADPTPEQLARGLERLVSPGSEAVGARGAQVAREELSWDRVARTWLDQAEAIL
jgi:glycosyltransferase involved in cell wall biosynthesis